MSTTWATTDLKRPDRYLDWEVRNRRSEEDTESEPWCSVYIEVKPDDKGKYSQNLEILQTAVRTGRQNTDPPEMRFAIRMTDEEFRLLAKVAKQFGDEDATDKPDPVAVRFFIYRPEALIYSDGKFKDEERYKIILAGPPIEGLTFRQGFERSIIGAPPTGMLRPTAIGIIDDGIAFAHERFGTALAGSRVEAIWLQDLEGPSSDNGVAFGKRLNKERIDWLLQEHKNDVELYRALGLLDFSNEGHKAIAFRVTHGTHVADLAAGFDPAENELFRPVFAVQLPSEATADTSGITMGSYVLQAFRQIMLWADEMDDKMPLVINFSYGILAGPKDGTSKLEELIDDLVKHRRKKARTLVVLSAGNNYRTRATAQMTFTDNNGQEPQTLDWIILPDDRTPSFLEIWFEGGINDPSAWPIELTLTPPTGEAGVSEMADAEKLSLLRNGGRPIAGVYYDIVKEENAPARLRIFIAVNPTAPPDRDKEANLAPAGRWRLSIRNRAEQELTAKFYIQRDDTPVGYPRQGRQSYFEDPDAYERDPQTGDYKMLKSGGLIMHEATLSAIANGDCPIVVGAAEGSEQFPPADYTSSGPTETRNGPDFSAIADEGAALPGILAAGTYSGSVVSMRGTSVAAPQVTRRLADLLANGKGADEMCDDSVSVPINPQRLGACVIGNVDAPHIPRRKYPSN